MVALMCPACHQTYVAGILLTMRTLHHFWNPAPGHTVTSLGLPGTTYQVTCPHCSVETEYEASGRVFKVPEKGVLSGTQFERK